MIPELEDVALKQIDAIHEKCAVITDDGQLVLWGRTRDGGILDGKGHAYQINLSVPTIFESQDGATFKQVSCGKDHIAAVTSSGRLLTFGNPDHGKLGHSPEENKEKLNNKDSSSWNVKYKPQILSEKSKLAYVNIVDSESGKCPLIKQVSCGFRHTACVTEDGDLYTWGYAKSG
jgi:alpha-tubulin suppressor-like RCC1 family protein